MTEVHACDISYMLMLYGERVIYGEYMKSSVILKIKSLLRPMCMHSQVK